MKKLLIFSFLIFNLGNIYCSDTLESIFLDIDTESSNYHEKYEKLKSYEKDGQISGENFAEFLFDTALHIKIICNKYQTIINLIGGKRCQALETVLIMMQHFYLFFPFTAEFEYRKEKNIIDENNYDIKFAIKLYTELSYYKNVIRELTVIKELRVNHIQSSL